MKLTSGIELLGGAEFDSNMYLIDGEVLIDCGSGVFLPETLEQMKRMGVVLSKINLIVLTHGHIDHIGAAKKLKTKTKAQIAIHKDDAVCLEDPEAGSLVNEMNEDLPDDFKIKFDKLSADILLEAGKTLTTPTHKFKIIHTPGHTPGSICLYEEDKHILISGDVLFPEAIGRADFPNSDPKEMKKSLEKIRKLKIETLLPGHDSPIVKENPYDKGKIEKAMAISEEMEDYL